MFGRKYKPFAAEVAFGFYQAWKDTGYDSDLSGYALRLVSCGLHATLMLHHHNFNVSATNKDRINKWIFQYLVEYGVPQDKANELMIRLTSGEFVPTDEECNALGF